MFRALTQFALSSFHERVFDPDSERAFAYLAVVLTLVEVHQFFDLLDPTGRLCSSNSSSSRFSARFGTSTHT
jgi:hypothetical protein